MGALDLKNSVIEYLDKADEKLLKVIKVVMETYWENETIAFSTDGKPLTKASYKKMINDALQELEKGHCITQEELEKESENWS